MQELIMMLNAGFTDEDKESCIPTIHKIVEIAEKCRRSGILSCEEEMEQEEDIFLKTVFGLVIDGLWLGEIEQVALSLILAENYSGAQLLRKLLLAEGIFAIWEGVNPRIISLKLSAMLGEKCVEQIKGEAEEQMSKLHFCYKVLSDLSDKAALPESAPFEETFSRCHDITLQRIMRNVEIGTMAYALHGCAVELIRRVWASVSVNNRVQICEDLEHLGQLESFPKENVFNAQKEILKVIEKLENEGEIMLQDAKKKCNRRTNKKGSALIESNTSEREDRQAWQ